MKIKPRTWSPASGESAPYGSVDGQPVAPLVGAKWKPNRDGGGYWALTVQCPYCGKAHWHGGNDATEPVLGGRAAHCLGGAPGGYVIAKVEGVTEVQE